MEQKDVSLKTIYVAIPSLYDEELPRTIDDAIKKAEHPERVFLGVALQDSSSKMFKQIKKTYKDNKNVNISFTKLNKKEILDQLGVGLGRAKSHGLYNDEDYVLQVDSHTMFEPGWDTTLISLHEEASLEIQNKRVVLTAYAGHYFLDESGNRTLDFPEGFSATNKFFYSLYSQFQRRHGVIPAASMVDISTITDSERKFIPASKFSANFAFGDREFARSLGLDVASVFFEEEVIQSVNLLSSRFSLVFPNVENAIIRHLYTLIGTGSNRRKVSSDYLTDDQQAELNERQKKNYLSFLTDESKKGVQESYERYSNISLELGRQSASTLHPSDWVIDYFDYEQIKLDFLRVEDPISSIEGNDSGSADEDCGCKNKPEGTLAESGDGHSHDHNHDATQDLATEAVKPKEARPWDMLDPRIGRVSDEVKKLRMDYCNGCEFFISLTQQCKKCGCHMPWKTGLPHASCPVGKWDAVPDDAS
jgi:hypothetical protein